MADVGAVVDRLGQAIDGRQVLREGFPGPVDSRQHRSGGDALDRGQAAGEPLALLLLARRQCEPAIAHDHGGDAVPAGAAPELVPGHLSVHMGVAVDEARRGDQAVGVERALRHRSDAPDLDDPAVLDSDVTAIARGARAVDDRSVADQQIQTHGVSPLKGSLHTTPALPRGRFDSASPAAYFANRDRIVPNTENVACVPTTTSI